MKNVIFFLSHATDNNEMNNGKQLNTSNFIFSSCVKTLGTLCEMLMVQMPH